MLFNLDDNRINGLVLADFQKAFDLVSQDILIEKLCIYMYGLDECKAPWVLCAPSFTTAGSARSSVEVHKLSPRLSRMEYHRGLYSLHYFSWYL